MKKANTKQKTHAYVRGFGYLINSVISLTLLIVVCALPLAPVFADELTVSESPSSSPSPTPEVQSENEEMNENEANDPVDTESSSPNIKIVPEDTIEPVTEESEVLVENTEVIEESIQGDTSVPDIVLSEGNSDSDTQNVDPALDLVSTTSTDILPDEVSTEETSTTSTDEVVVDVAEAPSVDDPLEESSTTAPIETETTADASTTSENIVVIHDQSRFMFTDSECVVVGDGSYYCSKAEQQKKVIKPDGVYAEKDDYGDKEIYIQQDGVVTQVTQNDYDDLAPFFDQVSNTVVWHRLIDGRYQIMSYSIATEKEEQITHDRFNNMEPQRFGDVIVWQGWIGDDWEVFMLTGDDLVMLTDNTTHDISPTINGDHIVWQSFESGAWRMKMYDVRTEIVSTIEDSNGGSIQNPRFVLVYDSKSETGDIETRGYDLRSGEVVFLDSKPAPIPEKLPDPEQTGEERALVTPPTQPKTKVDADDTDDGLGNGPDPTDDDLVIPPFIDQTEDLINIDLSTSSSELDIIVDATTTEPTLDTSHIEDVVVPPFELEVESNDSQLEIVPLD
jgi:hypothetical protein